MDSLPIISIAVAHRGRYHPGGRSGALDETLQGPKSTRIFLMERKMRSSPMRWMTKTPMSTPSTPNIQRFFSFGDLSTREAARRR
jgi:hypothetical protein